MIVLDASVVIAYLAADHPHRAPALELVSEAVDRPLFLHPLTLAEVLVGAARHGLAAALRRDLRGIGIQETTWGDDEAVRVAELRAATGLTMPDCCVLAAAESLEADLATFDQRLAGAAARRGVTVRGVE